MSEDMISNLLYPVISDMKKLKTEATKRRKLYDIISVKKDSVDDYYDDNWEFEKELKTKTKIKKIKSIDERLENKVWLLLYMMGYHELNGSRNFKIEIQRHNADSLSKQIDIFAKDDETVIIAECKACEKIRRRSLQKDIEEFGNIKGPISKSIKKYYGTDFKPKIIWLFITENIIWSKPDKDRAAGQNINIVTERELRYYLQIADHLKVASRHQFLAEFLKDQKIPELKNKVIPAVKGKLGGKRFYSFVTTPRNLLKIAFVNHRSLNDPDGAPTYQRLVTRTRMRQIESFINKGGFFPTNILINFQKKVRFDGIEKDDIAGVTYGKLYLPDKYRSAWVIDGQHRLYAQLSGSRIASC